MKIKLFVVDLVMRLCGFKRVKNIRALAKTLGISIIAITLLVTVPASVAHASTPLPPDCVNMAHHALSNFTSQYMSAGLGYAWQQSSTNSIIYAVQVAECGGMWLMAIWRGGNFQTNFFPRIERYGLLSFREITRLAWSYIKNNVRGFRAVPPGIGVGMVWPFHWVKVGSGTWDGCWVDVNNKAAGGMNYTPRAGTDWCAVGGLH